MYLPIGLVELVCCLVANDALQLMNLNADILNIKGKCAGINN